MVANSESSQTIQDVENSIAEVARKNRSFRAWATISLVALFATLTLSVVAIYQQNHLANQSKTHLDCIVKLFSTPIPADKKTRFISDPNNTCGIKFSS